MGHFESDAASCFDRIVMEMALVCFRNGGAEHNTVQMWEQTLQHAQHHIKTAYGISKKMPQEHKNYTNHWPRTRLQGSCVSMCDNNIHSYKSLQQTCYRFLGSNPTQTLHYVNKIKMFVDDASKYTNLFLQWIKKMPPINSVTTQLTRDAQIWERCLWTLGGLL